MSKTTYVYHDGRVLSKRLRRVELEMKQWRRDMATLLGFSAIFVAAAMIVAIAAPHVWPLIKDAAAFQTITTPHYR